jgi:hypothetical protein
MKCEGGMARNKIVDSVADAVIQAEVAIVRAGRQAVAAVQRTVDAGAAKVVAKKKVAKKTVKKAAAKTRKAVVKAKGKGKRAVRKVAKKVARKAGRRR